MSTGQDLLSLIATGEKIKIKEFNVQKVFGSSSVSLTKDGAYIMVPVSINNKAHILFYNRITGQKINFYMEKEKKLDEGIFKESVDEISKDSVEDKKEISEEKKQIDDVIDDKIGKDFSYKVEISEDVSDDTKEKIKEETEKKPKKKKKKEENKIFNSSDDDLQEIEGDYKELFSNFRDLIYGVNGYKQQKSLNPRLVYGIPRMKFIKKFLKPQIAKYDGKGMKGIYSDYRDFLANMVQLDAAFMAWSTSSRSKVDERIINDCIDNLERLPFDTINFKNILENYK
jgi:hypothetical protein